MRDDGAALQDPKTISELSCFLGGVVAWGRDGRV